jgi:hypothetical protein
VTKAEDGAAVAFIFGASGDTPVTFFLPPRNQLIFFKGLHPASTKYATAAAVINNISMIRRSLAASCCIPSHRGSLLFRARPTWRNSLRQGNSRQEKE